MTWRALLLLGLHAMAIAPAAGAQEPGVVRGRVRSEGTSAPLPGAVVELSGSGPGAMATVGADGRYELRGVPAGRRRIRARHLGYAPFEAEVVVPAGGAMELDIALRPAPVVLDPIRVEGVAAGSGADTVALPTAEVGLASARVLQGSAGISELGLAGAARGSPGQEPVDPSDVLYVRGAGTDLKLVYLDGAPVYAPFPLGGLVEPFIPDLLRSAEMYLGGAPARYDGGLSYVLDLTTRGARGDRTHFQGAADLLAARGVLETPVGPHASLLLSGREVHGLGTGALAGGPLPYGYREGMARGELRLGAAGALSFTGFRNAEEVWLGESPEAQGAIRWGNSAASLRFRGRLAGGSAELTAALGDFDAALPLPDRAGEVIRGRARRTRLAADLGREVGGLALRYGAALDHQRQAYRRPDQRGEGPSVESAGEVAGVYAELGWQVDPRVRLRGGVRADHFSLGERLLLAPRFATTWLVTERAALTLAAGRYHQYLRPAESTLLAGVRAPAPVPRPLALGTATHVALSLDQELGEGVRFGVEGFFKEFEGIPEDESAAANASGMDLWLRRGEGRWTGWAGYSLAWIWSLPDAQRNTRFAGRHLITSGVALPLGESGRLNAAVTYGAGLPYSAIPFSTQVLGAPGSEGDRSTFRPAHNSAGSPPLLPEPTRPYLRLDLSASRRWTGEVAGSPVHFTPYVRLLNSLGNRDALFYRFDRDQDPAPRPLVTLPLVPVLGAEWRF